MKRTYALAICLGVIAAVMVANVSQAQQRGNFRSQTALILSDALLLDQETTDKVVALYQEVSDARREEMRNSGQDFRNMSDEERTEYFQEYQSKMAEGMKEGLEDVLSDEEIEVVETLMAKRLYTPVPELRALRMIDLEDDQREELQPAAIALAKKIVPTGFRFSGPEMSEEEQQQAQEEFEQQKEEFIEEVEDELNDEQLEAWKENTEAVQQEIEEMMERRRSRQNN